MYNIEFTKEALKGYLKIEKTEPKTFKKLQKLIDELRNHPKIGSGKPKMLIGDKQGLWSRRITDKHRLVYEIKDDVLTVLLLTTLNHYEDK